MPRTTDLSVIRSGKPLGLRRQAILTLQLAVPAILAQLSSIIMQYIDASMVGRLGADDSASVGLVSSSLWLFWGICASATTGFSVLVAHRLGAGKPEEARDVLRQGITLTLAFSLLVGLIGVLIARPLPYWLGGNATIAHNATVYFFAWAAALPIISMTYLCGGILRAAGNMKVPALINVGMCLADVILNFFLIFPDHHISIGAYSFTLPGANLGVLGAAIGTVGAEILAAIVMTYYLLAVQKDMRLKGNPSGSFRPTKALSLRAFSISTPMIVEHLVFCGAQIMITVIVAPLGTIAIAANAFAVTAESICYMPGFGIGDAATTLTGQSHGAKRPDLVVRFSFLAIGLGVLIMTIMGALLYIFAPVMMSIMTTVPEIQSLGVEVLRIEAWVEPLYAASIVAYGAFVGVGDTMIPAIMNFGSIWAVRIPLAAIMAPIFGLQGVWIAMAVELSFRGLIFMIRTVWKARQRGYFSRLRSNSLFCKPPA